MRKRRFEMHRLQELVRLHRIGTPVREVSRLLRMGVAEEREYRRLLQEASLLLGSVEELPSLEVLKDAVLRARPQREVVPQQEISSVESWRAKVSALMKQGLRPRAIYDRLRLEDTEVAKKYFAIKRLCRSIVRARGVQPADIAIPVETHAGEVAQVDFGYVGKFLDPATHTLRRTWVFVMVLGYSRHMVAYLVFDQKTETWLDLHRRAFEELGGVVETVVPDNLKAAVIRAAFGIARDNELNRSYREVARHFGFVVDPAPPRQARKKGKVESGVKYVKHNGLAGLEGSPIDEARAHLARWVREVAGQRVHGTTGKKPAEVFKEIEAAALKPLPAAPFAPVVWKAATVHPDVHICFDKRLYSVPWQLKGKDVWVRATRSLVSIYAEDALVATHDRGGPGYRSTKEEHLPEGRRDLRHRNRGYWERRAAALGEDVAAYIREVFEADDVLSQLRTVQAIVTHLETFPPHRARAACARARHYGNHRYVDIKNILKRALDLEQLGQAAPTTTLPTPRYARSIQELLPLKEAN